MKISNFVRYIVVALLLLGPVSIPAQEEEERGDFYTIATYTVPFDQLSDYQSLLEEDMDLVEANEFILSRKVMFHQWAPDWSVVVITRYASFEDIAAAQERATELREEKYPDEEEWLERWARWNELTMGGMHVDAIVREVPSLTK